MSAAAERLALIAQLVEDILYHQRCPYAHRTRARNISFSGWIGSVIGAFARRLLSKRSGKLTNAAMWSIGALLINQVLRIAGNLILTRLLAPDMFGLISLILVVQVTMSLLSDVGVRVVVIQSPRGNDPEFLNTAWSLEILRGIVVLLCSLAIAGGLLLAGRAGWFSSGTAWSSPELPLVLAIAAFSGFIGAFQSTNLMTAGRNIDAKRVAVMEIVVGLTSMLVMIALSYMTGSIWALVAGLFAGSIITTIWSHLWIHGITNRLAWHKPSLDEISATGRWIMLSSSLFVVASQIDRYLLAGFISPTELGLYSIALNLVMMIELIGGRFISAVSLPSLSATARDQPGMLSKQLFRLRLPADAVFLSAAGFLFATGAVIIEILYDKRYAAAGEMLQLLSFLLVGARHNIMNSVYTVIGQPQVIAYVSMVKCISSVVFMSVLFKLYGLSGALAAVSLQTVPPLIFMFWLNKSRGLNNFRFELGVLLFWPAGYILGLIVLKFLVFAKALVF